MMNRVMNRKMNREWKKKCLAALMCAVMLAGCGAAGGNGMTADQKEPTEAGTGTMQASQTPSGESGNEEQKGQEKPAFDVPKEAKISGKYGRDVYLADMVYQAVGENTLVSPLSLEMALGLLSGGAKGQTKEELSAYLQREDYGEFAAQYMEYAQGLNRDTSGREYGGYKVAYEIANSIWVRDDRKLVESYAKKAKEQYQAEIETVSFAPEHAKRTADRINGWCDEKTHGLIPKIVDERTIQPDLATLLINSLYFESPWLDKWGVRTHTFTDFAGNKTEQEMLTDTLGCYYENERATAFSKRYLNGMEFIGILPKKTGEFDVQELDLESLLQSESTKYDVHALMPKLNFDTTADQIVPILQSQGIKTVFSESDSDLSGLLEGTGQNGSGFYVSDIIQKCKIELDEDGTRAAAVTAIAASDNAMMIEKKQVKEVYLDRPFAFLIYDRVNDKIVFLGKVVKAGS